MFFVNDIQCGGKLLGVLNLILYMFKDTFANVNFVNIEIL